MASQALYREWRPALFADVVGQDAIVTTLKNQVASGRIAHAYLFCGSRGTGKTTSAKILARAVNCEHPDGGEPCGRCGACLALQAENNLDIIEIDAASNNGVDEIRDLRDKIKYPPQHGRYRVYIIDEVHMLSTGAFNALLKTLEEPPAHAIFILATTEPQRLPATVLSRCQRYDFRRIPAQVIVKRLQAVVDGERGDVRPEALSLIARAAEGGMRDALSLLDMCLSYGGGSVDAALVRDVLGAADRSFLFAFADFLAEGDAAGALLAVDELMRSGREAHVFAHDVSQHLRALMLAQTAGDGLADLLEVTDEDAARYREQAKRFSRERLLSTLDLFLGAETDMKWSSQPRVALELAAVRACLPGEALRLESLASRVDLLEKKIDAGALPASAESPKSVSLAAAPQKPAPKTEPVKPAAPAKDDKEIWEKAMRLIRKEPYLYAPMMQGRFLGIEQDAVRIVFPKGGEIFLNMFKQGDRQEKVEAMLTEAAGRPLTVRLEMEAEQKGNPAKQKSVLQSVFDAFGRENVEVVDDPANP